MDWWHLALAFASFLNAMVAVTAKRKAESLQRQVQALEATVLHLQDRHLYPDQLLLEIPRLAASVQRLLHLHPGWRHDRQRPVLIFHPPSWLWMRRKNADGTTERLVQPTQM